MPFVAIRTQDGVELHINPNQVIKIVPESETVASDTQPPKHKSALIFAGGAKKEIVEGRARDIAKELNLGWSR